jgi:phytoene synthase
MKETNHLPGSIASKKDYALCKDIMRSASRNYSFASMVFPKDKLHHVEALYALMRVGDDRVDVSHQGFYTPREAIDDWENVYFSAYENKNSPEPVIRAYLDTSLACNIPAETMSPYFRAMREDLTISRFDTFQDLLHYMEGSALPVGRAMIHILGTRSGRSPEDLISGADSLSIGMQLSNFWRDIGQDWKLGRVYIPLEDMERFHVTETDLARKDVSTRFIDLLEFELDRTEVFYQQARFDIPYLKTGRWAVLTGLETYRAILTCIRKNDYDVFTKRASANQIQKLRFLLNAFFKTRIPA